MEAHKGLPGVSATIAGLQTQLAAAQLRRDTAKPPATRLLQATRLAGKRKAALEKATAAKAAAQTALDEASLAVEEATTAAAEAQCALDAAVAASGPQGAVSGAPSEEHWDTISAVLTQLHQLPAAMAAGNGNAAWLCIQDNGLRQLQQVAEKKALEKLQQQQQQQQQLDGTATPLEPAG